MSSPESFNIVFNSRGVNAINKTNLNAVKYFVNWGSILPKKYKKFNAHFIFKSENTGVALTDNGFVHMDFGKVNVYDGYSNYQNLGILYPVAVQTNATTFNYFYNSTNNDNNNFNMNYPVNQVITVNLKKFSGTGMSMPTSSGLDASNNPIPLANSLNYVLILNLTGILEDDQV